MWMCAGHTPFMYGRYQAAQPHSRACRTTVLTCPSDNADTDRSIAAPPSWVPALATTPPRLYPPCVGVTRTPRHSTYFTSVSSFGLTTNQGVHSTTRPALLPPVRFTTNTCVPTATNPSASSPMRDVSIVLTCLPLKSKACARESPPVF